jgi:hypothetical protein
MATSGPVRVKTLTRRNSTPQRNALGTILAPGNHHVDQAIEKLRFTSHSQCSISSSHKPWVDTGRPILRKTTASDRPDQRSRWSFDSRGRRTACIASTLDTRQTPSIYLTSIGQIPTSPQFFYSPSIATLTSGARINVASAF